MLKTNVNHNQITVLSGCELGVQIIYLNESIDTSDSHRGAYGAGCDSVLYTTPTQYVSG